MSVLEERLIHVLSNGYLPVKAWSPTLQKTLDSLRQKNIRVNVVLAKPCGQLERYYTMKEGW